MRKLRIGTGILEEYDYKVPGTKQIEKRTRENSIDTKSLSDKNEKAKARKEDKKAHGEQGCL